MKEIKKMPLVIISLIVLVLVTGTTIFFLNTRETEKNEKLNPKTEEKKAKEKNKDDSKKEEKIEEPVVEEKATQNTEEPTQNNNTNFSNNNNISSSSSSSNKSNNNYVAPSSPPVQNQQPQQTTPEPTCTPKKFDIVFRADFSSEAECDAAFNYYNSIDDKKYTSYKCSNAIDDCGVTYYMLTFYDINGNRFGYNEI